MEPSAVSFSARSCCQPQPWLSEKVQLSLVKIARHEKYKSQAIPGGFKAIEVFQSYVLIVMFLALENKESKSESVQPGFRMYEVHTKSRKSSHEIVQVTNYRFQKSMNPDWEIQPSLLYQAYAPASVTSQPRQRCQRCRRGAGLIRLMVMASFPEVPTVARDIIYGWARGLVGTFFQDLFAPEEFTHKVPEMVQEKSIYCLIIQGFKEHMEIIWIYIYGALNQ